MAKVRGGLNPSTQRYLSEIGRYPLLSRKQERRVAAGLRKDSTTSFQALVQSSLPFVVRVASEYRNSNLSFGDLISEGNVGLLQAARRYDCNRGTKFITYAVWWIRKSILKALEEQSAQVHLSSYQVKKYRHIMKAEQALSQTLGRKPERSEISTRLGEREKHVEKTLRDHVHEVSLDEPVGRDRSHPLSDYLASDSYQSPEGGLIRDEDSQLLRRALRCLGRQEREVLVGRFGLRGKDTMTLRELGQRMNLSRERVRQIEVQAKRKICGFLRTHACSKPFRPRNGCRISSP